MKNKKLLIGVLISLSTVLGACFPSNKVVYTPSSKVVKSHEEPQKPHDNEIQETQETPVSIGSLSEGEIVNFGRYEQDNDSNNGMEEIEWEVLSVENGKAFLLSRKVLDSQPFNKQYKSVDWKDSSLREWLNNDFMNTAFTSDEQTMILKTELDNCEGRENQIEKDACVGVNTEDCIFILNRNELYTYFDFNVHQESTREGSYYGYSEQLICEPTQYAKSKGVYYESNISEEDFEYFQEKGYSNINQLRNMDKSSWWIRAPYPKVDEYHFMFFVSPFGGVNTPAYDRIDSEYIGVRPALYVKCD